jgi:metal-responsive CopG/Arc/MetJ family transcriptional regulator
MKVKTSVTLSEELLKAIDQFADQYKNRSDFIEIAAWALVSRMVRDAQNAKDLKIINRRASRLNREAAEVLTYQVAL